MSVVPGTILPPICAIVYWLPGGHVGVGDGVPAVAVGVTVAGAVGVGVDVGVAVGVAEGVPVGVAVGVPHGLPPLVRCCTSARNWKVWPTRPPTLQICP